MNWCSAHSWYHWHLSCSHLRWTTVSDLLSKEGGVKQRESGKESSELRQGGSKVIWRAVNYETVEFEAVLVQEYYESFDGVWCDPNSEDILHIEDDEED